MRVFACAILCAAAFALASIATASETYQLENNQLGWGMRLDNFGPSANPQSGEQEHYFDFGSGVTLTLDPVANQATISGTIRHIQSNQLWTLSATLSDPVFTSDGSVWHSAVNNNLYTGAMGELVAHGANENHAGEMSLKDANYGADRLAFLTGQTQLTLNPGQGNAAYVLPGQTDGQITLYDFPQPDDMLPFMFTKGHRINNASQTIVGFGWLDARPPSEQTSDDGLVQDYWFHVGDPVPPSANSPPSLTFTVDGVSGNITINERFLGALFGNCHGRRRRPAVVTFRQRSRRYRYRFQHNQRSKPPVE